MAFYLGKWR